MKQKQFLRGIVTGIAGLVLLIVMTACAGTIPGVSNASGKTLKITGSITAVDTTNNTVRQNDLRVSRAVIIALCFSRRWPTASV